MPYAYDQDKLVRNIFSWAGTSVREVVQSKLWLISLPLFAGFQFWVFMMLRRDEIPKDFEALGMYALGFFGSLFVFQMAWYINTCYQRFQRSWLVACKGMARLNDLSMQVYSYLSYDHELSCDVMRLMHAANHMLYIDQAMRSRWDLLERRHLITPEEREYLESHGASKWFQCACWALQYIGGEVRAGRLEASLGLAMDRSICEWRQNTTHHGDVSRTPIPFAYYHLMLMELILFKIGLTLRISLCFAQQPDDDVLNWRWAVGSCMMFAAITLIVDAMLLTAVMLSDAWGTHTENLPVEEYLLIPFMNSRTIFASGRWDNHRAISKDGKPYYEAPTFGEVSVDCMFLRELHEQDVSLINELKTESGWAKQKTISASKFRKLDRASCGNSVGLANWASPTANGPQDSSTVAPTYFPSDLIPESPTFSTASSLPTREAWNDESGKGTKMS